jgi:hypothetical protein
MGKRRRARELVLQALYESEFSDRTALQVVEEQIERRGPSEEGADRARDLFLKTVEKRDEIDRIIRSFLENWDFERLSLIDRRLDIAAALWFLHLQSEQVFVADDAGSPIVAPDEVRQDVEAREDEVVPFEAGNAHPHVTELELLEGGELLLVQALEEGEVHLVLVT